MEKRCTARAGYAEEARLFRTLTSGYIVRGFAAAVVEGDR
jgi:hypothetical protein